MNKNLLLMIIILITILLASCTIDKLNNQYIAEKGQINLEIWDFELDGIVELDGEWEFYPQELYSPKDFNIKSQLSSTYIDFPSLWNISKEKGFNGQGYATYRLLIYTSHNNKDLALKIPIMQTAYRLWVNGEEKSSNGIVGRSKNETKPHYDNEIVFLQPEENKIEIVIQIANFHHARGGAGIV